MYDLKKLVQLHNQARAKSWWTLKPLTPDDKLMHYAQTWAATMARSGWMRHSSMRNILKLGFSRAAENIAWNQQDEEAVMSAWLWSPAHRWNIMSGSSNVIGVGVCNAGNGPYWCACFGRVP